MVSLTPTVYVTGTTGAQGFSLARYLRQLNWNVHSTTRNLNSPRATALAADGVKLVQGDWDDDKALEESIAGCDKLFLCLMPTPPDLDHERKQAENILRIAKAAGVKQVISSTSLGVSMYGVDDRLQPGTLLYAVLAVKKGVEQAVIDSGFESHTFLRPAYFMTNFTEPLINMFQGILNEGTWTNALTPDTRLGLVDFDDISKIALAAFEDPEKFKMREVGIASEMLTPQETLDVLGEAMGKSLTAKFMTDEEIAAQPFGPGIMVTLDKSLRVMDEYVNMEELKAIARLNTFKEFLEREKESVKKV